MFKMILSLMRAAGHLVPNIKIYPSTFQIPSLGPTLVPARPHIVMVLISTAVPRREEKGEMGRLVRRLLREVREEEVEDRVWARLVLVEEGRKGRTVDIASPSLHLTGGQEEGEVGTTLT